MLNRSGTGFGKLLKNCGIPYIDFRINKATDIWTVVSILVLLRHTQSRRIRLEFFFFATNVNAFRLFAFADYKIHQKSLLLKYLLMLTKKSK